jgi:CubicO group peptidase (beta-lactamase class C family)
LKLLAFLCLDLAICSPTLAHSPALAPSVAAMSLTASERQGVDAEIRAQMKRRAIPGLQIAIVRHGRIAFSGAYGIADVETGARVMSANLFTLNSSTKAFTGVAIMQLVQAGKMSLDAPASTYLDDLPAAWRSITVRQLLTHVSGLPEILDLPNGQGTGTLIGNGGEISAWETVRKRPVEAAPGASYRYNQTNYVMLGKIIDRVAGKPFARFVAERQFVPAGVHIVYGDARDVVPGRVRTYRYAGGTVDGSTVDQPLEHAFDDFSPFLRTAGGLNGSATDVARWLIALEDGRLLSDATRDAMWSPGRFADGRPTPWGMGWPLRQMGAHPAATAIGGRRSAFFVYPKDDLAIVVLTNLAGANPEEFIDEIAGVIFPDMRLVNGGGLSVAANRLRAALVGNSWRAPENVYSALQRKTPGFSVGENELNEWGGRLLGAGRVDEAASVFALNTQLRPNSFNTWDSLGEAFEAQGRASDAAAAYRRSLALDQSNDHARARLAALTTASRK